MNILIDKGVIARKDAFLIKLVLAGLAKHVDVEGNKKEKTRLSLTVQDNKLYLGPLKLMSLNPLLF